MLDPGFGQGGGVVQASYGSGHKSFELAEIPEDAAAYQVTQTGKARLFIHVMGAVASLALIAGGAFWGYKQAMRDLHGVPVVRALEGPMRVAPDSPGGEISDHAGLAVNDVQAVGEASAPEAELILAPAPVALTEADVPGAELKPQPAEAAEGTAQPETVQPASLDGTLPEDDPIARALALADAATAGAVPLSTPAEDTASAPAAQIVRGPGVARSPRPPARPIRATQANVVLASASATSLPAAAPVSAGPIDAASVPAGTRLVQLGAFDSTAEANAAWARIAGRFGELMADKQQVVLEAKAGGRSFWRLRAMGFENLSEARRFCAALVAESADCIPVVAR